jgi:hypothetical protein
MTELDSILKEQRGTLGFSFVTNPNEFQTLWAAQRFILEANMRRLLTPEIRKYCDRRVRQRILQDENEYVGITLHESLKEVKSYLEKMKYRYFIHVYLSTDSYLPNWKGITILIEIPYRNFREKMKVWREIEERITKVFSKFKESNSEDTEKIDDANEVIATDIEKLSQ